MAIETHCRSRSGERVKKGRINPALVYIAIKMATTLRLEFPLQRLLFEKPPLLLRTLRLLAHLR